jgi:hypothetical protein
VGTGRDLVAEHIAVARITLSCSLVEASPRCAGELEGSRTAYERQWLNCEARDVAVATTPLSCLLVR